MDTVVDYEVFALPPRYLFLRTETEEGVVGWGEATVGGFGPIVRQAVELFMEDHVLGETPMDIEDHWQKMYYGGFYHGGPILMSAISAIDQSLWDLKGKLVGVPVYDLLRGRCRERIRVYQSIGGDQPTNLVETATEAVEEGLTALKMNTSTQARHVDTVDGVASIRANLERVHEAVGSDVSLAVDLHGRIAKPMVERVLSTVEPYQPLFVEEPIHPEYIDDLASVTRTTTLPIAAGGRMYSQRQFKRAITDNGVDVVQPCVSHAGGITGLSKIADMAESAGVSLAPHGPVGPVAYMANLQISVSSPALLIQQQPLSVLDCYENAFNEILAEKGYEYASGYVEIGENPGLGVALDEVTLREESRTDIDFQFPVWRTDDGSVAKW